MFGIVFFLFSIVCSLGGYFIYGMFSNFIFRALTRPLQVPKTYIAESRRDMILTFIVLISIPLMQLGVVLLLITYVLGIALHFIERRAAGRGAIVSDLPRIPHVTLGELMIMSFSLACSPLMASAIVDWAFTLIHDKEVMEVKSVVAISAIVISVMIFPLCFVSAMHRLNGNRVPPGRYRALFLFIYPYVLLSIHVALIGIIPTGFMWLEKKEAPEAFMMVLSLYGLSWLVLIAGGLLAWLAKRETIAAMAADSAKNLPVSENQTLV